MSDKNIEILVDSKYKDFRYICVKNYFGAYAAYIDITNYSFLQDSDWFDRLPFHRGCTFSGTFEEISNDSHWLIGCDWQHDNCRLYGIEDCSLEDVENNVKNVIDSIPELVIIHSLKTGKSENER